jgi:hypothetical protein
MSDETAVQTLFSVYTFAWPQNRLAAMLALAEERLAENGDEITAQRPYRARIHAR